MIILKELIASLSIVDETKKHSGTTRGKKINSNEKGGGKHSLCQAHSVFPQYPSLTAFCRQVYKPGPIKVARLKEQEAQSTTPPLL